MMRFLTKLASKTVSATIAVAFLTNTVAFAAGTDTSAPAGALPTTTELYNHHLPVSMMATLFTINSAMTVDQALHAYLPKEDYAMVKAYFDKEKIDISGMRMWDSLVYDNKIHYGTKTAAIQDDLSIKVDGVFMKFDKTQTPGENYLRFFKQFAGKPQGKPGYASLLEPAAAAQEEQLTLPGLAPTTGEALKIYKDNLKAGYTEAFKGLIDSAKQINKLTGQAAADAVTGTARVAGNAVKAGAIATRDAAVTAGRAVGTAANVARTAVTDAVVTGARVAVAAAGPALAAAAIAGTVAYAGNWAYHWWNNGSFECGPKDGEGHSPYVFNYTSDQTTLGWEHFDQRIFNEKEMSSLFMRKEIGPCTDDSAKLFSSVVQQFGKSGIEALKDVTFQKKGGGATPGNGGATAQ